MDTIGAQGVLRVATNSDLKAMEDADAQARVEATRANTTEIPGLSAYILNQWQMMRRHRDNVTSGWTRRLIDALRMFNRQYDPTKLEEIKKFGGSEVYSGVVAVKCRGASSLLRDVYLGSDKPWGLSPDTDPPIPPSVVDAIKQLVSAEIQGVQQGATTGSNPPIEPDAIRDRINGLMEGARQAAKAHASKQAKIAEDKIDEILREGGFYDALAQFIVDLPLFPYACIKGPIVRVVSDIDWQGGAPNEVNKPKLFWQRVSPFDIYWTPGVSSIADANVIERQRFTRKDLNDMLDVPGYNVDALRAVLEDYGRGGLSDNWDMSDSDRAVYENRENPRFNQSGLINCLEFQGYAQGITLLQAGMDEGIIDDPLREYFIQAWLIGRHIIKVQLSPSVRKRHQYYVTSFEKVPGTPVGNALPDILSDIQDVCNASLRALVNNLSIASGPQVVVNDDRLSDDEDGEELYPWKRWHVKSDPMGNGAQTPPVSFFQPMSNSQDLLQVYNQFVNIADELSAVPRYMTGAQAGSVGRTASGLSMLMGNASKILQTVAANIDGDIMQGILSSLYDMLMLTDPSGILTGAEQIRVLGVNVAIQKETNRQRQQEFLQATANNIDMSIIGPMGRAKVLREVANTIGLPGDQIVPPDDVLQQQQKQAQQVAAQQGQVGHSQGGDQANQAQDNQQKAPGPDTLRSNAPRINFQQQRPQPSRPPMG